MPPSAPEGGYFRRSFIHACVARAIGEMQQTPAEAVLRASFPDDRAAGAILRGAVEPTMRADLPGNSVVQLMSLAPQSAAAKLFESAVKIDLTGISSFSFPLASSFTEARFVQEGYPIPVGQGNFTGMTVGPVCKVAMIAALSNQLQQASAVAAETIISNLLKIAVGNGLAKVLFSDDAASAAAPAGLLNGVSALTATTGGGFNAMVGDLRGLLGTIDDAGIDTSSVVLVMSAAQAVPIGLMAVPGTPQPQPRIITAPGLAAGTIIAIATNALAVAGSGAPTLDVGKHPVLHMFDPAEHISTAGTPNAVAAPVVSMVQTDSFALKCIARITWAAAPGAIQVITSATW